MLKLQKEVNEIIKKLPDYLRKPFKRMEYALEIFLKEERRGLVRFQEDNDYIDDFETSEQFLRHHFGNSITNFQILFEYKIFEEYHIDKKDRDKIQKYLEKIVELTKYGIGSIKFYNND